MQSVLLEYKGTQLRSLVLIASIRSGEEEVLQERTSCLNLAKFQSMAPSQQ